MYFERKNCRACGWPPAVTASGIKSEPNDQKLIPVFSLGLMPLANDFKKPGEENEGYAPVTVNLCPRCHLAQLSVVVDPAILYHHYAYRTSPSKTMLEHFGKLALLIKGHTGFGSILEIGSNDGRFLKYLKDQGAAKVQGIEPAANLAKEANQNGIPTLLGTFDCFADEENLPGCPFDVVIARHVFCHIDDWRGFIKDLGNVTHKDSLVCIEVPWAKKTLDNWEFDTIYHEHLSYWSIGAMMTLLGGSAFKLVKLIEYPIHGGAMMALLRRLDASYPIDPSVHGFEEKENLDLEAWMLFEARVERMVCDLRSRVNTLIVNGKTVAAFGASAKSTVLMRACGFTRKDIAWIADCTPEKQGRLSPGSDIPIVDEGALLRELPDYCLITAWNFADEIVAKNKLYLDKGGHFLIPIPEVKIIGA